MLYASRVSWELPVPVDRGIRDDAGNLVRREVILTSKPGLMIRAGWCRSLQGFMFIDRSEEQSLRSQYCHMYTPKIPQA